MCIWSADTWIASKFTFPFKPYETYITIVHQCVSTTLMPYTFHLQCLSWFNMYSIYHINSMMSHIYHSNSNGPMYHIIPIMISFNVIATITHILDFTHKVIWNQVSLLASCASLPLSPIAHFHTSTLITHNIWLFMYAMLMQCMKWSIIFWYAIWIAYSPQTWFHSIVGQSFWNFVGSF